MVVRKLLTAACPVPSMDVETPDHRSVWSRERTGSWVASCQAPPSPGLTCLPLGKGCKRHDPSGLFSEMSCLLLCDKWQLKRANHRHCTSAVVQLGGSGSGPVGSLPWGVSRGCHLVRRLSRGWRACFQGGSPRGPSTGLHECPRHSTRGPEGAAKRQTPQCFPQTEV